ncbi:MAG: hypothetical protein Q9197_005977 [Variospora fuerteventurae]
MLLDCDMTVHNHCGDVDAAGLRLIIILSKARKVAVRLATAAGAESAEIFGNRTGEAIIAAAEYAVVPTAACSSPGVVFAPASEALASKSRAGHESGESDNGNVRDEHVDELEVVSGIDF